MNKSLSIAQNTNDNANAAFVLAQLGHCSLAENKSAHPFIIKVEKTISDNKDARTPANLISLEQLKKAQDAFVNNQRDKLHAGCLIEDIPENIRKLLHLDRDEI